MCGIAGGINLSANNINDIISLLKHRGPDAQAFCVHKKLSLVHTRLSIQDLGHGSQPFSIGNHVIIFNGEIYNHLRLRNLIGKYKFTTQCDTETLLALFIEHGISVLSKCDGMFAFAILDKNPISYF